MNPDFEKFEATKASMFKILGRKGTHEQLFDLALSIALWAITGPGNLSGCEIQHNGSIFVSRLDEALSGIIQKQTPSKTTDIKRLM